MSLFFAFQENNGNFDVDSIAETYEECRLKVLENSMGWRFQSPHRYSQDFEWKRLEGFGKIVPVKISTMEHSAQPDSN